VAESVVMVVVEDNDGNQTGSGSAFLINGNRLVTNAHVVSGGKPFVRAAAFKIPCTIERISETDDLAILRPAGELAAPPLTLVSEIPSSGSTVYAIGNPRGLDRTISQGLLTGRREIEGRTLLQLSAAVSPGSSGGPVVTANGDVVGVVLGFITGGQALNFAVPVRTLMALAEDSSASPERFEDVMGAAEALEARLTEVPYDGDPASRYQALLRQRNSLLERASRLAGSIDDLLRVANLQIGSAEVATLRRASALAGEKNPSVLLMLAQALGRTAVLASDTEAPALLAEAEGVVSAVIRIKRSAQALLTLGDIQSSRSRIRTHTAPQNWR
jgi:hypothetical protein